MIVNFDRSLDVIIGYGFFHELLDESLKLPIRLHHNPTGMFRVDDVRERDEKAFMLESCKPNPDIERFSHMDATAAMYDQVQVIIIFLQSLVRAIM